MNVLVSAGPTREAIDPVRFITNHSSGKMGYAIAEALCAAGHSVTLVSGPVNLAAPEGLTEFVRITSAADMAREIKARFPAMDAVIMCAAVADYRPVEIATQKIHKSDGEMILRLERTEDILYTLGTMKKAGQLLIGFAAETEDLRARALGKMERKNLDWIAANTVGVPGRGFQADDNAVTLYARTGEVYELPLTDKKNLARQIVKQIFER
ncbi:MAG: phosphopantothenoylcysteine decarboxylase [Lentisphaeria bacterium]|nr:phosphopantothenoylcysteine decarboxylase [Lentisphaeria bacterium]